MFKLRISIFVIFSESSLFMGEVTHKVDFLLNKKGDSIISLALFL